MMKLEKKRTKGNIMKKKWFKIMLISIIVLLIGGSIFIMYLVNNQCMEKGQKVIFGTWGKNVHRW